MAELASERSRSPDLFRGSTVAPMPPIVAQF